MSPEQARGEKLDGRTDLYAVGIILWELLTGRQLFPQSEAKLIERVRDPNVEAPSTYAPRVPPALDDIVMKALAKDKTLRFADCEAFRAALAGFLAQTAPTTDSARVAGFLRELFEGEIEDDRNVRGRMLEDASKWAAENSAKPKASMAAPQNVSQPETVSLQRGAIAAATRRRWRTARPAPAQRRATAARRRPATASSAPISTASYLVRRLIGEGGMGLVYEAEHVEIGRRVAVKVLHAMYTRQPEVVARFRSEARAATRIGHPHIIDVFDSGTTVDGAVYFVMEFLEGRDLSQLVEEEGPLPAARAIAIAREICQALMAAHKAGILHRDLKPENVFLIDRDGKHDFVKVLDFGIAKTMEAVTERVGRLTNPGVAMGTPEYMAPEQAAGLPVDARADVYAVGAIIYEMMSGRPPHEGAHIMEVLTRKATVAPTPLERVAAGRAARSRVARHAHAGDLARAAAAVDGGDGAGARQAVGRGAGDGAAAGADRSRAAQEDAVRGGGDRRGGGGDRADLVGHREARRSDGGGPPAAGGGGAEPADGAAGDATDGAAGDGAPVGDGGAER